MCVISIVCFVTLNSVSSNILEDSVTATGLGIAFYYGLTGLACTWYFRRELRKSTYNLIMVGLPRCSVGDPLHAARIRHLPVGEPV